MGSLVCLFIGVASAVCHAHPPAEVGARPPKTRKLETQELNPPALSAVVWAAA